MPGQILGTYAMTLHVHDLARAARFWEALGLAPSGGNEEVFNFAVPDSGPLSLHRWQSACATNGGRPPGTVSGLMLATDDAKAACERVAKAGGQVIAPPFPAPAGGMWAVAADPDGNEFMLCAP